MHESITHLQVPVGHPAEPAAEDRRTCLGPDGSAAHVGRTLSLIDGRWKLPILFRLFAEPRARTSHLLRGIPDVSHKMLTQHLRELERDGLVARTDFGEQPPRVEYELTASGRNLMPVLRAMRDFSRHRSGAEQG